MDTPIRTGFGETSVSEKSSETCPTCGQSTNRGLEQLLGKLGISEEMINNLRSSMKDVDVEEYLNTAREYVRTSESEDLREGESRKGRRGRGSPGGGHRAADQRTEAGVAFIAARHSRHCSSIELMNVRHGDQPNWRRVRSLDTC